MAIRFDETDVRAMGRPAGGVKGIELEDGDAVVSHDRRPARRRTSARAWC